METITEAYYEISNPDETANYLHVKLYYLKDGLNIWTGSPRARGYYLGVHPVYRKDYGSYSSIRMEPLGAGGHTLIEGVQRKSAAAASRAQSAACKMLPDIAQMVLERAGKTLTEEASQRLVADADRGNRS